MKHAVFGFLVAGLCLGSAPNLALAAGNPVDKSLGNLRWGMSTSEVMRSVVRKVEGSYKQRIKKAKNTFTEDQLRREAKDVVRSIRKSHVEFDGSRSNWDVSHLQGEFTHGNEESMLVYKEPSGTANYYFFFDDRLWKWVKTFDSADFGGRNFKKFSKSIKKRFGKGKLRKGELNKGSGKRTKWVEYVTRQTRFRAADNTKFYDMYSLIFEQMDTVRSLSSLRRNTIKRGRRRNSAVASLSRDYDRDSNGDDVVDGITGKDRRNAGATPHADKAKKRKSIFAEESAKRESASAHRKRQAKAQADARKRQQRLHERKQGRKAGKVLTGIEGMDDDDPLGGL